MAVTINTRFGGRSFSREYPESTTVGQVLVDDVTRAALGLTGPVRALVSGVELPESVVLAGGETLVLETRAQTKGVGILA